MGLLERISARTVDRRAEARSTIDTWLDQYLLPANQFTYNGTTYPFGLNTTWAQSRQKEIANSLPGYLGALRGCPPAFAAQMVRAVVLSQARFTFRNLPSQPNARKMFGTRALSVLEKPWPKATTGQLIARMEWHAGLAGNAYVYRQPDRLRVLRPDWVSILFGSQREPDDPLHALDGEVIGYVYVNGGIGSPTGKPQTLLPDEVAHWSPQPDPERAEIGMSWITPALRDIQADQAATEHKIQFFAHGATPNLVVKGIPAASADQFKELVDMMEERHAGVMNAYRTLYLTAGADATVVGANLSEINIGGVQGASETRISFLSRVPAALLGIQDGMKGSSLNAGNYAETRRTFSDSWIYPTLQDLCAALSPLLEVPAGAELWFDPADMPILREDSKDAAAIEQVKSVTITTYVKEGFTAESAIAAVRGQDISLLKHSGMVSVQLQPPGSTAPDAGGGVGPKAPTLPQTERKFNPAEPRRPDGKWGTGGVVKDALKLADRIQLGKDEQLAGSDFVDLGDMGAAMAVTRGPNGSHLRLGLIYHGDERKWSAADKGGTVVLDQAGVDSLHDKLTGMGAVADKRSAEVWASYDANMVKQRELNAEIHKIIDEAGSDANGMPNLNRDQLAKIKDLQRQAVVLDEFDYSGEPDVDETFAEATIPAGWGNLALRAEGRDDEHDRWDIGMDVAPKTGEPFGSDYVQMDAKGLSDFLHRLADMRAAMTAAPVSRAAGHDTTPGHDELHHYWTVGAGREKWVHSPKPWTTLVALLTPHIGPERAKVYASRWFIEVKGYAAGSDINRVVHGKPPRGNKVGPG